MRPQPSSGDGASVPADMLGDGAPLSWVAGRRAGGPELQIVALDALDLDEPPTLSLAEPAVAVAAPRAPSPAVTRPPLPSWGVVVVGGLALLSIALTAALAIAVAGPDLTATTAGPERALVPSDATPPPAPSPASFPADPAPIPIDLLTRLEDASSEPLDVELTRLLDAIQHGFGGRSAQLEPTLRSYVYRMTSRFEWTPDTFRVAVTAPDPALVATRAALLERLFEDAVAAGRLDIGTGTGPHALTLVTE